MCILRTGGCFQWTNASSIYGISERTARRPATTISPLKPVSTSMIDQDSNQHYILFKKLPVTANRRWSVQVNVEESPIFYIGWEWEAEIHERMCRFQVNGIPGWGISEFMYRNMDTTRPEKYEQADPDWTRTINKGWKQLKVFLFLEIRVDDTWKLITWRLNDKKLF